MAGQLARLPARRVRRLLRGRTSAREAPGAEEVFLAQVRPEGYRPLTASERADLPSFTRCISCGLCSLVCPALAAAPAAAWSEPWTFVVGPSRLLERAGLAASALEPCARCATCAAVCPTGVPIPRLAAMVQRLAGPTGMTDA
jgi:succinate dehydrogenase/fumarate reductase-like Fe-S protein